MFIDTGLRIRTPAERNVSGNGTQVGVRFAALKRGGVLDIGSL